MAEIVREVYSDVVLSRVGLFQGLKDIPEALKVLSGIMTEKSFQSGHYLTKEGEIGDELYILIQGQVSIYKKTPDGDSYKVAILKHDIAPALGEGGLVEAEPRSASVKCDGECRCLVLTKVKFDEFCKSNPAWAVPILQKIASMLMGRLRQTNNDLMLLHKALMSEIRGS